MRERGNGETTRQMLNAPHGAVFVWCNGRTAYPEQLARILGRVDLQVVPLSWLTCYDYWRGRRFPGVVIDHAAELSSEGADVARNINNWCRPFEMT